MNIPKEYDDLAKRAAWNAALITGLRTFDRQTVNLSRQTRARRQDFKMALTASLDEVVRRIPKLRDSDLLRIKSRFMKQMGTDKAVGSINNSMAVLSGVAAVAVADALETLAQAYFFAALGDVGAEGHRSHRCLGRFD